MNDSLDRLLAIVADRLGGLGIRFAIIGGCARNAYATPRATRDVDVAVVATVDEYRCIVEALAAAGFTVRTVGTADAGTLIPDVALFQDGHGGRIDILIAKTEFERRALERRVEGFRIEGHVLPVVTPEDLIVYKMIAGRPRDFADAEEVARARRVAGTALDWSYVEHWCTVWGIEDQLATLRRLLDSPQS